MATSPQIHGQKQPTASHDILKHKKRYILQIAESIASRFPHVNREEIETSVEQQYDGLRAPAKVYTHIPSLIEGQIRSQFRRKYPSG
jgi:hypothetical protein